MPPNGGNLVKKRPTRKRSLMPRVEVPSMTETFINSLQQQIGHQQKHIKALRIKASFQQVQLEWYKKQLKPLKSHICWACDKNFARQDSFYKHVRESKNYQHQVIADFIDETFCQHCNISFQRPRDLVKHERKNDIERLKCGIGLLAQSDPESENTTLNLQALSRGGPDYSSDSLALSAVEANGLFQDEQGDVRDSFGAKPAGGQIIPAHSWRVSEPHFSSTQYIGLPTANCSTELGNEFLGAPYDGSQSQCELELDFSSAQCIGLPTANYWTALRNGFFGAPYDGSQSQNEWGGFSSTQYIGLPTTDYSTALGNERSTGTVQSECEYSF